MCSSKVEGPRSGVCSKQFSCEADITAERSEVLDARLGQVESCMQMKICLVCYTMESDSSRDNWMAMKRGKGNVIGNPQK